MKKIDVKYALNGIVLTIDDEEILVSQDSEDEIENFADLLRELNNHFGPTTNKYSDKRIYVLVAPGWDSEELKICKHCDRAFDDAD